MNIVKNAGRIVFKVGSSTLTYATGRFNLRRMESLARVLSDIKNSGREVVLVSSGAISAGRAKLGLDHKPQTIEEKQATAAVGQSELMKMYDHFFTMYGNTAAQILITKHTLTNPVSRANAENTFKTLLRMGCIPVVNENDTVAFDEIKAGEMSDKVGENDTLSAYVSILCGADALINLSDTDGLYDRDPRTDSSARLIPTVAKIDETIYSYAGGAGTDRGTGGVFTKLKAAELACGHGIPMFIVNGENPELLYDLLEGRHVGTYFMSNGERAESADEIHADL